MAANESYSPLSPERAPDLIPGWGPVRVKKRRQIKNREPRCDVIGTGLSDYWLLLPVLLFLEGAAAALGASVLRTVPQGSEEVLASGIFLKESL